MSIVFGTIRERMAMGSFFLREKDRMRERKRDFLFGPPHPSPLPKGEGILIPNVKICTEHY
jgi:hypothetical protein